MVKNVDTSSSLSYQDPFKAKTVSTDCMNFFICLNFSTRYHI